MNAFCFQALNFSDVNEVQDQIVSTTFGEVLYYMKRFCDRHNVGYNSQLTTDFMVKMARHLNVTLPEAEQEKRSVLQGIRNKYYALVVYPEEVLNLVIKKLSDYGLQNKPLIPQQVLNLGILPPLGKHATLCLKFFTEYFAIAEKNPPDETTRNILIAKYRLRQFLHEWLIKVFNHLHLNIDDTLCKKVVEGQFDKGRLDTQEESVQGKRSKNSQKQKKKKITTGDMQQTSDTICEEVYLAVAASSTRVLL